MIYQLSISAKQNTPKLSGFRRNPKLPLVPSARLKGWVMSSNTAAMGTSEKVGCELGKHLPLSPTTIIPMEREQKHWSINKMLKYEGVIFSTTCGIKMSKKNIAKDTLTQVGKE